MSVDRTKILEAAQKHLAKGAYDKAIVELQKLVKADPSDVRTWLKIGDLYAKKGSTKDAVETYAKVADQYSAQGFFLKAVAVHKQILKLDPSRLDVQLRLADAYENLQLTNDALQTYEQVAGAYARAGDIEKALETLGKMCELEPDNIPIRIKYAEALSKANKAKEAADAFEVGMHLLEAQGRIDDSIKVAERLLFHRPEDVALSRKLSKLYLERNDAKRALAKLQVCFKADPKDVPTLEMLAEAFHQLGQLPKTISVYREVARIHQEANRAEERARTLKRILELDPGDAEARQALASYAQPAAPARRALADVGPPPGAVIAAPARGDPSEPPEEIEEIDDIEPERDESYEESYAEGDEAYDDATALDGENGEDVIIVAEDEEEEERRTHADVSTPSPASAPAPERLSQRPQSILPPEIAREAQIAKLLTETEVFLRYGLKQKVVDQLRRVLEIDPQHVQARERLKDLLIDRGDVEGAIGELIMLADLFIAQRPAVASLYLRQVLDLDPENGEAHARIAMIGDEPRASDPGSSAWPPRALPAEPQASLEPTAPEMEEHPHEEGGVFFVEDADEQTAAHPRSAEEELAHELEERASFEPAAPSQPMRLVVPPPAAHAFEETPEEDRTETSPGEGPDAIAAISADPLAPMSPEEFESAPLYSSAAEVAPRESIPRLSMPPGEVEELLDEAEFFVAQGLYEEARMMLADSARAHPRNRLIADKLAEVEELAAQAQAYARAAGPASADDQSFELAEKLAEDLGEASEEAADAGSDVLDVERVFAQFKKGVEAQVGLEDTETHFDLGIAYKEMGLIQDAIGEFTLCLTNPQKACIAHTMIGLCQIEKGEVATAISHFKKGLYAENKTDREELGLYYELGRAYELLHDPKEALYYYEKVRKRESGFRNVNERIDSLTRPGSAPASQIPNIANDDIDAAFDDLMGNKS